MARGKPIGPTQAEQALRLIAEGKTLSEIATIVGLSYSGLHRALTETWPDEYAEAKQRRDDVIRNEVWNLRADNDKATQRWAYDHLIKWHLPEARDAHRLEISGPDRQPIQLEGGQRPVGIAAVFALAQQLGVLPGNGGSPEDPDGALSAARNLRPELGVGEDEPAAGAVAPPRPA